jgi:hypothetical protein
MEITRKDSNKNQRLLIFPYPSVITYLHPIPLKLYKKIRILLPHPPAYPALSEPWTLFIIQFC